MLELPRIWSSKRICQDTKRCANCTSTSHSDDTCGDEPKCLQCDGNHRSGYKKCREYLFECEVLAVQSKSRISKKQARLIFERENPNFRKMNYSQAVISNTQNSETPLQQPTASTNHPPKPPNETTQQHAIVDNPIHEDERTSRNNPQLHYEVKKIFNEYDPSNQDRSKYEEELKKSAVKRKSSSTSPNRKEKPKSTNPKDLKKSRGDYSKGRAGSSDRRRDDHRRSGSQQSRSGKKNSR